MTAGVVVYLIYANIPFLNATHHLALRTAAVVQPMMIFSMLFITFCKIDLRDLRLRPWHAWLLLFQTATFCALALAIYLLPLGSWDVVVEGAMLCLICPTATAAAVVTAKLDGDAAGLTTYTILINTVVALVVPAVVPLIHPVASSGFVVSFLLIMGNVFPTLICPLLAAQVVRLCMPKFHKRVTQTKDLAFYMWAFTLWIAIAISTHSIVSSHLPIGYLVAIAIASLGCCVLQFWLGRLIGAHWDSAITAGQSLGQKNTTFAIWMGFTFLTPVSSIAGGFYSVWHNVFNSWQLYRKEKQPIAKP